MMIASGAKSQSANQLAVEMGSMELSTRSILTCPNNQGTTNKKKMKDLVCVQNILGRVIKIPNICI